MAKLDAMPDRGTIVAARHRVDYYLWMGIPVARSWPRYSAYQHSAAQLLSMARLGQAARITGGVDDSIKVAWEMHVPSNLGVTWIDGFRSVALGKATWTHG